MTLDTNLATNLIEDTLIQVYNYLDEPGKVACRSTCQRWRKVGITEEIRPFEKCLTLLQEWNNRLDFQPIYDNLNRLKISPYCFHPGQTSQVKEAIADILPSLFNDEDLTSLTTKIHEESTFTQSNKDLATEIVLTAIIKKDSAHRIMCELPITTEIQLANQIVDTTKKSNILGKIAVLSTDFCDFRLANEIADTIPDPSIQRKLRAKIRASEERRNEILENAHQAKWARREETGEDSDDYGPWR